MANGQINWLDEAEQGDAPLPESWRVRTSKRIKSLKIQVYPHGGVEVVAPPRTRPKVIEAFVAENSEWIGKTRRQFADLRPPEPTLPEQIYLRASNECIRVRFVVADQAGYREQHGILTIRAPVLIGKTCWPLLQQWLKKRARKFLPEYTMQLAEETHLYPKRVNIRLQKTRWGSCSSRRVINLNAALMLQPPEDVRYVIIHELCHLRHMNHSRSFWSLVGSFESNWKKIDKRLDQAWQTSPNWLINQFV
ncbi:MAG: M48 family metallopeptidase [Gammaproteobacteria bacterium]